MSDTENDRLFVGIDIAKGQFDLLRSDTGEVQTRANDPAGIRATVKELRQIRPARIVLEATGGFERPLLYALLEADLPAALAQPGRVRSFAKGLGILAKTDAIDARVLAIYAEKAEPRLAVKRRENQIELEALVTCRRQLASGRADQKNRRQATTSRKARRALDTVLKTLDKQIKELEAQITKLISNDDDMSNADRILQSVTGVGPVLSATILAEMSELGTLCRRSAAALVGVAPYNNDSGPRKGTRSIRGGRADVRCTLYMPILAAMKKNPVIRAFAERLEAAGKPHKVVATACMRKLIGILNAMLRDNLTWDQLKIAKNT